MATDGSPTFEAIGQAAGAWYGVAKVEDEAEINRLAERKAKEISEEEYGEMLKKKSGLPSQLAGFREVDPTATLVAQQGRALRTRQLSTDTPVSEAIPDKAKIIQPSTVPAKASPPPPSTSHGHSSGHSAAKSKSG